MCDHTAKCPYLSIPLSSFERNVLPNNSTSSFRCKETIIILLLWNQHCFIFLVD